MLRIDRSSEGRLVSSTLIDLVSEHLELVHRGTSATGSSGLLLINALSERPGAGARGREEEGLAVVPRGDHAVLVEEKAVAHGELAELEGGDGVIPAAGSLDKGDGRVVADVAEAVPRGGESDGLDPASAVKLAEDVAKDLAGAPVCGGRLSVDFADHGVDDAGLVVG